MTKPEDIPQDVWTCAEGCVKELHIRHWKTELSSAEHVIARAIMAEREACALFIEQRDGLIPERQEIAAAIRNRGGADA